MQGKTSQNNSYFRGTMITVFSVLAGIILLLTGTAKIISSFGRSEILVTADPIFGLTFRHLIILGGLLEIATAVCCFFQKNKVISMALVAWLSSLLFFYRVGLIFVGWHHPCPCVGNITDALNISPEKADFFMKMILAYLLVVSYGSLFFFWRHKSQSQLVPPTSRAPALENETPLR